MKKIIWLSCILCGFANSVAAVPVDDASDQYHMGSVEAPAAMHQDGVFVVAENDRAQLMTSDAMVSSSTTSRHLDKPESERLQLLYGQLEQLQQEVAQLRGQMELQAHQLARLQGKPVATHSSFVGPKKSVKQVVASEESADVPAVTKRQHVVRSQDPMEEQLQYLAAFEQVKQRHFDVALGLFQRFIGSFPEGPYAANAHYWLGELYLRSQQYEQAVSEFNTIIHEFDDSSKLAAAHYKLGITLLQQGRRQEAQDQFALVTQQFPGTSVARLARMKLSHFQAGEAAV